MTIEDLSARLDKVERQNRWMRAGAAGALVALLAVGSLALVAPAGTQDLVRARKIEVVDGKGKVRLALDVEGPDTASLRLTDAGGRAGVELFYRPESQAGLVVRAPDDGSDRMLFNTEFDGTPYLRLLTKSEQDRVTVLVRPDGSPTLRLVDKAGKTAFEAPNPK